ncbi:MAG: hypothetical protein LBE35_06645 [Clostridiales bacterium]|jgi:hypothetical protein|nr:hypothetical protein [Clostridiales bacterium]
MTLVAGRMSEDEKYLLYPEMTREEAKPFVDRYDEVLAALLEIEAEKAAGIAEYTPWEDFMAELDEIIREAEVREARVYERVAKKI